MVKRERIRACGRVMMKESGRPVDVFSKRAVKQDNLKHEILLTEFLRHEECNVVRRGSDCDQGIRADAEMEFDDGVLFVELDTGSEGYEQVINERFNVYQYSPHKVLWVTLTPSRLKGLQDRYPWNNGLFTVLGSKSWV